MYHYIRDGKKIYEESFSIIRREADLGGVPSDLEKLAVRIIHASGSVDIIRDLAFSKDAGFRGAHALSRGATILCDSQMVAHGITRSRLPKENKVLCTLNDERVPGMAEQAQTTRAAVAVELWREYIDGAVIAIGNAPTALFHLLELLQTVQARPALVLGFPVGFVGAVESKCALSQNTLDIPYIVIHGRRGGSAIAAAAVNALASEQE